MASTILDTSWKSLCLEVRMQGHPGFEAIYGYGLFHQFVCACPGVSKRQPDSWRFPPGKKINRVHANNDQSAVTLHKS